MKIKLNVIRQHYPFERWIQKQHSGLPQYSVSNCQLMEAAVDSLIDDLERIGEQGTLPEKLAAFKKTIVLLHELNKQEHHSLIETGEREELVELFNDIASYAGIDRSTFECNDITLAWRDW